ncbi:unnamed protein product, partial [Rotaria sp. Silwood1]
MNLEFTVTETIIRDSGAISEIQYEFEEFTYETVSVGMTSKREKRSRVYDATIKRQDYNILTRHHHNALSFDDFILILRPFMLGYYQNTQLEILFQILDKNQSGSIDIDNLAGFLPIINEYATMDTLKNYIRKCDFNTDGHLTYDEF